MFSDRRLSGRISWAARRRFIRLAAVLLFATASVLLFAASLLPVRVKFMTREASGLRVRVEGGSSDLAGTNHPQLVIPRLIHTNYMAGADALRLESFASHAHFRAEHIASCRAQHPGWNHVLWDAFAADNFVRKHYPWFVPTWEALGNSTVLRSGKSALLPHPHYISG